MGNGLTLYESKDYILLNGDAHIINRDGIVAQWFPLTTQSSMASRAILNIMMENFKILD